MDLGHQRTTATAPPLGDGDVRGRCAATSAAPLGGGDVSGGRAATFEGSLGGGDVPDGERAAACAESLGGGDAPESDGGAARAVSRDGDDVPDGASGAACAVSRGGGDAQDGGRAAACAVPRGGGALDVAGGAGFGVSLGGGDVPDGASGAACAVSLGGGDAPDGGRVAASASSFGGGSGVASGVSFGGGDPLRGRAARGGRVVSAVSLEGGGARRGFVGRLLASHVGALREGVVPSWFASVMGTGIVAVAAVQLPERVTGLRVVAMVMWLVAVVLLVVLVGAVVVRWRGGVVVRQLGDPVKAPFLGVPPMAVMTVGAGALLAGRPVLGEAAVVVAAGLWVVGTVVGVAVAMVVPVALARRGVDLRDVAGAWLLPVVPPMVSAATGAGLVAHAGGARGVLLDLLYGLFGLGLTGSVVMIALVLARVARHGTGPARTVPALWIVLGPLGQSVTAASLLGDAAGGRREEAFALWYGVPAWTCAMVWLVIVAVLTARTARRGLPFSTAWWGFVFPVGTVVTGTSRLAERGGSTALAVAAVALFIMLIAFWALTAARAVAAASPAFR